MSDLVSLAQKISSCHEKARSAFGDGLATVLQTGQLLAQAKGLLVHGKWLDWVEENTTLSRRSAQSYLQIYSRRNEIGHAQSLRSAMNLLFSDEKRPKAQRAALLAPPENLCEEGRKLMSKGKLDHEQAEQLAKHDPEDQESLLESVENGRQTMEQAIAKGQVPAETPAEEMERVNSAIESWCRSVAAVAAQCPEDPWLTSRKPGVGDRDGFLRKIRDALASARTCKCVAVCAACEGAGCRVCIQTGRLPKSVADQLA